MDLVNLLIHIGGLFLYALCMKPFKHTLMDNKETISGRFIGFFLLIFFPITLSIIYITQRFKKHKNIKE